MKADRTVWRSPGPSARPPRFRSARRRWRQAHRQAECLPPSHRRGLLHQRRLPLPVAIPTARHPRACATSRAQRYSARQSTAGRQPGRRDSSRPTDAVAHDGSGPSLVYGHAGNAAQCANPIPLRSPPNAHNCLSYSSLSDAVAEKSIQMDKIIHKFEF